MVTAFVFLPCVLECMNICLCIFQVPGSSLLQWMQKRVFGWAYRIQKNWCHGQTKKSTNIDVIHETHCFHCFDWLITVSSIHDLVINYGIYRTYRIVLKKHDVLFSHSVAALGAFSIVWSLRWLAMWKVWWWTNMMTSSNGNIFRVTGPLCKEFTGHQCIPHTKASDMELWCFLSTVRE